MITPYIKAKYVAGDNPFITYVWGNVTVYELEEIEKGLPQDIAGIQEGDIACFVVRYIDGEYVYDFKGIE